jgi:serine/threonine protein phosphatase 1
MPTIAVGDIHGNLPALSDLLDQLRPELTAADTVVFLGDYIDRGPDSCGCIDAIVRLQREGPARVVGLLGNHEEWFLRTLNDYTKHSWLVGMEGFVTIRSYSPDVEAQLRQAIKDAGLAFYLESCRLPYELLFDAMPPGHREFFSGLDLWYESPDCICTHAGLDPGVTRMAEQTAEALVWGRVSFQTEYTGAVPVVYGHWNNAALDAAGWPRPRFTGNTIGIDTSKHGVLTAIRMPDRRVFQSARYPIGELAV